MSPIDPEHLKSLWDQAERLSQQMPRGTAVRYWTGERRGTGEYGTIRHEFTVVCGSIVGWVDTHPACIAATHIEERDE